MKEADRLRMEQEDADTRAVMSTKEGRRYVWRLIQEALVFHPCETPEREGARRLGLFVLGRAQMAAPGSYLTMQKEAMADDQRRKKTNRSPDSDDIFDDGGTD